MINDNLADIIFTNGRIYTVDKDRSWIEAVAVKEDRIIWTGSNEGALEFNGENTRVVDLQGRMMLPGFIDAHAHPIWAGFIKSGILLNVRQTVDEVLETVSKYIKNHPEKEVYFGQGYSEWMFDSDGPQKELLDRVCPKKPIVLIGAGLHSGWCNSKALEIAGITKDTPDPDPGAQFYRRKPDGTPNGSLVEGAPINSIIDAIQPFCEEDVRSSLLRVSKEYTEAGVTSIQDGGSEKNMLDMGRAMLTELIREGYCKQRIRSCEFVNTPAAAEGVLERLVTSREKYNNDFFKVDILKIINDGSFEARSAAILEPYEEDNSMIHPMLEGDKLYNLCHKVAEEGFDISIHAIGDWTTRETLNTARELRRNGFHDCRISNIHCIYIADDDLDKFAQYDVIANTTPIWHHKNVDKERIIGYERANKNFLMNSLNKKGVILTFGSDYPADEYGKEPLKGIEIGVTRQMYGVPEDPILPPYSERLTVKTMIEGYTINAAYQMRMEDKIGSIEVGKYADLVILEDNLFEIDPHDIHCLKVDMTVFNGEIVYSSNEL